MGSKFWFGTTIALSVALALSILLLPPWSPLSITIQEAEVPGAGNIPQRPAGLEGSQGTILFRTSQTPDDRVTAVASPAFELPDPELPLPPETETAASEPTTLPEVLPGSSPQNAFAHTGATSQQELNAPTSASPVSDAKTAEKLSKPTQTPVAQDIEELIKATEDPIWKVRWDAVNALGELQDSRGIPALVQRALHDDNPHPRWRSLWALKAVNSQGLQVVPALRSGLHDPDPVVVRNAAIALAFFAQPEARPELLNGLKDPDPFARWEAVFILREVINSEVAMALIPLLDEETESETRVRQQVALTLGSFGGDEAISALLSALRKDPSSEVRWRAALALSRVADPSVVAELEQALPSEEDPRVRKFIEDTITKLQVRQ